MFVLRATVIAFGITTSAIALIAQDTPARVEFEVVSIKKVDELRQGGGMRSLPDGTFMMMNQPMGTLVNAASPVQVLLRDIIGMPDWMMRDRYDVTVKPPAGLSREQLREQMPVMWRAMFADRMKLVAHVEQRERDVYQLVVASSDGKLGPDLKPSTLDCSPRPVGTPPPAPQGPLSLQERQHRCGMAMSAGLIVSGGITMDRLVPSLGGLAGGEVQNRT